MDNVVGTVILTNVPGSPALVGSESFYGNQYLNLVPASNFHPYVLRH